MGQRSSDEIRSEIEERLGFFPPFFGPALDTPGVLDNLWFQTKTAYLDNPIPALFKEKLFASLGRFCAVPYCLLAHASALVPHGITGPKLLDILLRLPLGLEGLRLAGKILEEAELDGWPSPGSSEENAIFDIAIAIFLKEEAADSKETLRKALPKPYYDYLCLFLSYINVCLTWAEQHPEISTRDDARVQKYIKTLEEQDPRLPVYFENYRESAQSQVEKKRSDEASEIERRRLLSLFEQAPVPLAMLTGAEHTFTYLNPTYKKLFLGTRTVVGKRVVDALPEVISQGFVQLLDNVYQTGKPFIGREVPVEINDGNSTNNFVLDFIYQPVRNAAGEIEGILAVITDVTEQVKARDYVRAQFDWLTSIFDKLPTPLMLIDPKTSLVTFSNEAADKITSAGLSGTIAEERYKGNVKAYDKSGRLLTRDEIPSVRAARGDNLKDYEFTLESDAGHFHMLASAEMIPASYGHEETALLLLQDISAIRAAEEQFRLFAELAPQMPFIADAKGNITYYSRQWYEYIGHAGETQGWGWTDTGIHHPDDLQMAIDKWTEAVSTGNPYQIEYRLRRHDGVYRWHLGRAVAVKNANGEVVKWFGTNVDVHDQKLLLAELEHAKNAAEAASETKSSFLANMSHEIRTPLGAILGFTDILMESNPEPSERQQYLDIISRNGKALTRVIDDILDLSKVEAGRLEIQEVEFSLNQLLQDIRDLFSATAANKGVDLHVATAAGNDVLISDPARLRQILVNVVGNAVKFTERGSIQVLTNLRRAAAKQVLIDIEIKDSGPGLSASDKEKLFHPFSQADNSSTRRFGGTGLGLVLSRRLAHAMGGNVVIQDSEVGVGSTFLVSVLASVPVSERVAQVTDTKTSSATSQRLKGIRVLVVEDSPDNQTLINIFLSRQGAKLDFASDGREGIEKALSNPYDVVLMDIQMPTMDGFEAIAELHRQGFAKPVYALTAHALSEERRKTEAAGFSGHLTKPINSSELIEIVSRYKPT